ncbi:glutathione S-transferase N-terminal domain-containing protein [Amaricoccus sp.]|uniref:glutathione S-transferase N-terminal domain-containing protein n=1 Tax=Amaricoccus sp. TaxID=1872485 RepID=UPI001B56A9FF|nr:glutathione S-transferase N-terminal domain-containing protein [Amaricoccus sp.]MBP7242085.1 glutathione S-transferase N-terminal domain-containing protein [Amaricoccus sp.]
MSLDAPTLDHPITARWPAQHPDRVQLYSWPTPNGIKVSAMLEETGLSYEPHLVSLSGDQMTPEFLSLNPNNKIPAIIDPNGPDGRPLGLFESGAILIYLADKTGMFLPSGGARYETIQWLMFQIGGVGPMFGQIGYFNKFAGREIEDRRPLTRYVNEAKRLLGVLDARLDGRDWMMGEYTIADMALWPWVRGLEGYEALDLVEFERFANVKAWLARALARPASQAALNIPDKTLA